MDKDRAKKLDTVFSQIEKQFGEGSLMKLGSDQVRKIPSISTGALSIDLALGIGGVPRGRVIEIYGPESSGKTTLSLHIAAEAQKLVELLHSLTQNMLSIQSMQAHLVLM